MRILGDSVGNTDHVLAALEGVCTPLSEMPDVGAAGVDDQAKTRLGGGIEGCERLSRYGRLPFTADQPAMLGGCECLALARASWQKSCSLIDMSNPDVVLTFGARRSMLVVSNLTRRDPI